MPTGEMLVRHFRALASTYDHGTFISGGTLTDHHYSAFGGFEPTRAANWAGLVQAGAAVPGLPSLPTMHKLKAEFIPPHNEVSPSWVLAGLLFTDASSRNSEAGFGLTTTTNSKPNGASTRLFGFAYPQVGPNKQNIYITNTGGQGGVNERATAQFGSFAGKDNTWYVCIASETQAAVRELGKPTWDVKPHTAPAQANPRVGGAARDAFLVDSAAAVLWIPQPAPDMFDIVKDIWDNYGV